MGDIYPGQLRRWEDGELFVVIRRDPDWEHRWLWWGKDDDGTTGMWECDERPLVNFSLAIEGPMQ